MYFADGSGVVYYFPHCEGRLGIFVVEKAVMPFLL